MLWIEPSAACNIDCAGCPTAAGRLGGVMDLDKYRTFVESLPRSVRLFNLWHRGEPLAAHHFPEMVAIASARGIKTQTHSNGTLLAKKDFARRIVEAGLTRMSIGVDGPDQETYVRYRIGGRLSDVEAGIRALAKARSEAGVKNPQIFVECLLGRQTTEQYRVVKDMVTEWGADEVKFKTYRVPDPKRTDIAIALLPDNTDLWRYSRNNGHLEVKKMYSPCLRVAWSATITYDGNVLPCCFDAEAKFVLGNAFEQPWDEIWNGENFERFRKIVMKRGDAKPKICLNCTEGLGQLYKPERIVFKQKI